MITRQAVDESQRKNAIAIVVHTKSLGELNHALTQLCYMRNLYRKNIIPHSLYQAFRARTARHRGELCDKARQLKTNIHTTRKEYDKLNIEYCNLTKTEKFLSDTLGHLSNEQLTILKQHFSTK